MEKQVYILGSTGSIDTQALDVVEQHADLYKAYCLTANNRYEELAVQARKFKSAAVVIANESLCEPLYRLLDDCPEVKVYTGKIALDGIIQAEPINIVLTALAGFIGLSPTIQAIKMYKEVCLANKEMLVVAGELICKLAQQYHIPILPVGPEHSTILQSLVGEDDNGTEKILLTTSGGPFRTFTLEQMKSVTIADALKHPVWEVGTKITTDSATMTNKGFEVIGARWLFGVPVEKMQVLIHLQSIVHSAVQFIDGGIKAQLGVPDMCLPIQYAFLLPGRLHLDGACLDTFKQLLELSEPNFRKFKCLALAYESIRQGSNMPCVVNVASEVVNKAFRRRRCTYLGMADVIEKTMERIAFDAAPTFGTYVEIGTMARCMADELITK